jgi:hypothetical protein
MSAAKRMLIGSGLVLAALGMLYGLYYALFIEHQTLDQMGTSLTQGFVYAADRRSAEAHEAIERYGATKYDYVRQVDLHSHWIGLAMLMIVLGAAFDWVALSEPMQRLVAFTFTAGAFIFPLGVILQTVTHGSIVSKALAIAGSGMVTIALGAVAWGFSRRAV